MNTIIKQGHADWDDLVGKEISFEWSDGWENYYPCFVFSHTQVYADDSRYPKYYICGDAGGYSVWENERITVTVHE